MPEEPDEREEAARALLEALMGVRQPQQSTPGNIITGLDVTKLIELVFEERPRIEPTPEEFTEIREILAKAEELSRQFIDVYVKDGLSRIVHPVYGADAIVARFTQIATMLRHAVGERWKKVVDAIEKQRPPAEVAKLARQARMFSKLAVLTLVAIYDKLLTLLYINAPPEARPPLATLTLGYELLRISEEEAEKIRWRSRKRRKTREERE